MKRNERILGGIRKMKKFPICLFLAVMLMIVGTAAAHQTWL
jgi:ribosomal protein S2